MFGLQPTHLLLILVIALIIFGPKQLPELGKGIGKAISEFKKSTSEMNDAWKEATSSSSDETKKQG